MVKLTYLIGIFSSGLKLLKISCLYQISFCNQASFSYEFPRTVSVKSGSYGSSSEAYAQGFSEGKKLRIREPLEKKPLKRIR